MIVGSEAARAIGYTHIKIGVQDTVLVFEMDWFRCRAMYDRLKALS